MSFVQRELDRIRAALLTVKDGGEYHRLYAAQQALSWATEPQGFRPPYDGIMGIQEGSRDCSAHPHLPPS